MSASDQNAGAPAGLDAVDRRLLMLLQEEFPLVSDPFAALGEQLGLEAAEVMARVARLKASGVIRRLGAVFELRKLGYTSTLCALKVPPERLNEVARVVNAFTGVTHNYLREHEYNLWFTLIGPSRQRLEVIMAAIRERTGLADMLELKAEKIFKIKVNFDLEGKEAGCGPQA